MFENILLGPICISYTPEDRVRHLREIDRNGYFPIVEVNKGELIREIELSLPKVEERITSVILCISHKKMYKE